MVVGRQHHAADLRQVFGASRASQAEYLRPDGPYDRLDLRLEVNESVMVLLGGSSWISVKARAVLPYDNNAHPRILPRVFWSTVFSLVEKAPCREIRIM